MQVYEEAYKLFSRHDSGSGSEWPSLRRDLADLAGPAPLRHKMRVSKRMSRVSPSSPPYLMAPASPASPDDFFCDLQGAAVAIAVLWLVGRL